MQKTFRYFLVLLLAAGAGVFARDVHAQVGNSGTIEGTVKDASGGAISGAAVEITNPVSGYNRSTSTDSNGSFTFSNVPFNPYHLVATAKGFSPHTEDVDLRSSVPVSVQIAVQVEGTATTVTVEANGGDLIETGSTFHTDVDRDLFDKLPLESASSSLSSLVTLSTPGVAADSNGLFHGLGDHAENSFSIDGQPITDQQSKVFSNQIPSDSIQSIEVISGAPPAEYGGKTSLVIDVTTRSGQGVKRPTGSISTSYGSFGTASADFDLAYGGEKWGNFIAANGLNSGRFLDPPEFVVMHAKGNEENIFDRVDYQLSQANSIHVNFQYTRSWFQNPNSFDQELHDGIVDNVTGAPLGPTDQRAKIGTFNISPTFTRLINSSTAFTIGAFVRQDQYHYYPSANPLADLSPDLQAESVGQYRKLTNAGVRSSISFVKGVHNLKAGITYQHTFLTENDSLGIVDPTFNPVCFSADGSPNTDPNVTSTAQCGGPLDPGGSINAAFSPILACSDLTRPLPTDPADPCAGSPSSSFLFRGHTDVKELALYVQDTITLKNWTFSVGVRGDLYNGLISGRQAEPRLGVAYNFKPSNTVLRVSYARTLESPFNENLVLSSTGCNDPTGFISALIPCVPAPLAPGYRNEFHAGFEQAFGKFLVVDGEYIWKYTHNAYDFSTFGATPITFPVAWQSSKIPGYAIRASIPNIHGFTAFVVMSSVAARFFPPQLSGLGVTVGQGGEVFRIDHDEKFNSTAHVQYQPWKKGPWLGLNWRYDSGLVAGAVPCFGGNCAGDQSVNGVVDVSGLTADQQFQAGLFCGSVRATPMTPISPTGSCLASQYGSTLLTIPKPGTENDDHNPPRVAPRSLFDVAIGDDNLFQGEHYKWSLRLTAINITNKYALYNFLSTFSGTHFVTPRSYGAELGFHF